MAKTTGSTKTVLRKLPATREEYEALPKEERDLADVWFASMVADAGSRNTEKALALQPRCPK